MPDLQHLTGPAALQTLTEAIIITDREWTIRFINDAARHLLDLAARDLVGTSFADLTEGFSRMHPDQYAAIADGIHSIIADNQNHVPVEARSVEWITGQAQRQFVFRARPIWSGKPAQAIGILIRIDDKPLEWTPQDLYNAIWHDLRAPLTSIHGFTDLLLRNVAGPLTDIQRDLVTQIQNNTGRLLTLRSDWEARQGQVSEESDQRA